MATNVWSHPHQIEWSQCLLSSYRHWTGRDLLEALSIEDDMASRAEALFFAPFVVISHGTEVDPVLNYGNQAALDLWEMSWDQFIQTPSRLTAEPMHQAARSQALAQLKTQGFIEHYRGIRISSTGRRFWIENTTIWNLIDEAGKPCGQAATFPQWSLL